MPPSSSRAACDVQRRHPRGALPGQCLHRPLPRPQLRGGAQPRGRPCQRRRRGLRGPRGHAPAAAAEAAAARAVVPPRVLAERQPIATTHRCMSPPAPLGDRGQDGGRHAVPLHRALALPRGLAQAGVRAGQRGWLPRWSPAPPRTTTRAGTRLQMPRPRKSRGHAAARCSAPTATAAPAAAARLCSAGASCRRLPQAPPQPPPPTPPAACSGRAWSPGPRPQAATPRPAARRVVKAGQSSRH